jgi:hypothetical protein
MLHVWADRHWREIGIRFSDRTGTPKHLLLTKE